jgi:hypothetical protein
MIDRPGIMVMTPCYGVQVGASYCESILRLQIACQRRGVDFGYRWRSGDALITRVRAELVAEFLAHPHATHLLFIDADISFDAEQVFRLLDFDADVTAAAYPVKEFDWEKIARAVRAGRDPQTAALNYVTAWQLENGKVVARSGFAKVRYAGTGFLMIRREVLIKLCEAHPELKYRRVHYPNDPLKDNPHRFALFECMIDPDSGEYLSEDFAFCRRWTDLGGEIWLDVESKLDHSGQHLFVGNLANTLTKRT